MGIKKLAISGFYELWNEHVNGIKSAEYFGDVYQLVLDALELSIAEVVEYLLQNRPTYEQFEAWVLEQCDKPLSDELIEKTNRGVSLMQKKEFSSYPLPSKYETSVFNQQEWEFWDNNGYIILKNAVPKEDCKVLEQAMWKHLDMSPDKPEQWMDRDKSFWIDDLRHPIWHKNRSSERIKQAFQELWGATELFMSLSRLSFNPPLHGFVENYGPSKLHWDASINQPMPFNVIGMLYLNDVSEEQGAFQCVSGFHREIEEWLSSLPEGTNPRDAALSLQSVKVPANSGDLIICRQELPHASSINRADYPRFVQYIAMYPADIGLNPIWK